MTDVTAEIPQQKDVLRFKVRVEEGVLIPDEPIAIPSGRTYLVTLQLEPEQEREIDALAEIVAMAQPLGPPDLARNFDTYTGRRSSLRNWD